MKWFDGCIIRQIQFVLVLALGLIVRVANADFTFGSPINLGSNVNSPFEDAGQTISVDGLSLYFSSDRPGGSGDWDLWVTGRATTTDDWGEPQNLGAVINTSSIETSPCLSMDGLSLFFGDGVWHLYKPRPGGFGKGDLWVSTKPARNGQWSTPVNLGDTVNTTAHECDPSISADGLSLFFDSDRSGGSGSVDLWVTHRPSTSDPWASPVHLGSAVNSSAVDAFPSISPDGLILFFMSDRTGDYDLWMTRRASVRDGWAPAMNLGPSINCPAVDACPTISPDGYTLFFMSMRAGGIGGYRDLWQASIVPVVDFNGDGIVHFEDFSKLFHYWQQSQQSVDISPPIGNGIVDARDVALFAERWLQGAGPLAHWKLDETQGTIAHDSAGDKDATLYGEPAWQPTGGIVDGALQFDGMNDYVSTPFVLNPAEGEFSVFAWIKGDMPGQVIISQIGSANWLAAEPFQGGLITDLKGGGRFGRSLWSQAVITDGHWHRVGLTWDGASRVLYVDDVEVAKDTQSGLGRSQGGLYIGVGKNREVGTFFCGLIDDVRIYNRAIVP